MEYLNNCREYCIKRLNAIQMNSDDSFFDYDIKNKVAHLTYYGVHTFGMPKTVEGMPEAFADKFVLNEDREAFLNMYAEMEKTKSEVHCGYRMLDGNGTIHYDEVTMIPVSDELALGYVRDVTEKKLLEFQLGMMEELTVIENMLILTHRDASSLDRALESLTSFLSCTCGFIFTLQSDMHLKRNNMSVKDEYLKRTSDMFETRSFPRLPYLAAELSKGRHISFESDQIEQYATTYPNLYKLMTANALKSVHLIPILENGQEVKGFMVLVDPKREGLNEYFYKLIGISFSRAFDNVEEQKKIDLLVSYDLSTHLLNRNRYIEHMKDFNDEGIETLGCVEFDVNGLHEYNNSLGHAEGDKLLLEVANAIRLHFGNTTIFRTGGDEFVAICKNETEEKIRERIKRVKETLGDKTIYVSAGLCYRTSDFDIEAMNREADKAMYMDKDNFYIAKRKKRQ